MRVGSGRGLGGCFGSTLFAGAPVARWGFVCGVMRVGRGAAGLGLHDQGQLFVGDQIHTQRLTHQVASGFGVAGGFDLHIGRLGGRSGHGGFGGGRCGLGRSSMACRSVVRIAVVGGGGTTG